MQSHGKLGVLYPLFLLVYSGGPILAELEFAGLVLGHTALEGGTGVLSAQCWGGICSPRLCSGGEMQFV